MKIRFISSLDPEDEIRFATAMVAGVTKFLDQLPIAYTIRLETADGKVVEHHHAGSVAAMEASGLLINPAATEKSASLGNKVSPSHLKIDEPE